MTEAEADAILDRVFQCPLTVGDAALVERALADGVAPTMATRIAGLLRRFSLVLELVKASDSVSLDTLLPRLIELITEALGADRATLFLYDDETRELFSRVSRGDEIAEIRIPADAGIAGAVFTSGRAELIPDAYADPRFNQQVDRRTGYRTRSILCVPLRNRAGQAIGVTQVLNKHRGGFDASDQALLEAITAQGAAALEHAHLFERLERARKDEADLLEVTESISSELELDRLLGRIVTATTTLLDAERSTLFVHDRKTNELWSRVAEGADVKEIRIPAGAGIAGTAFSGRRLLNIPDAYADPRFNQEVDRRTGFRTRSILAMPVLDRAGVAVGIVQVLNKRGGPFGPLDERRLKGFSAQIAIAIQNAQLFADVLALKNYNESILKSLTNGVVTLDEERRVVKLNEAARRILGVADGDLAGTAAASLFGERNGWVLKSLDTVAHKGGSDYIADADYVCGEGRRASSVNLTVNTLFDIEGATIGYMLVFEDITREKRMRGTMARYMAKEIVEKLLEGGEDALKGSAGIATILFSDIRRFTSIAEQLTARQTVEMLNQYFTEMVEVIFQHGGILDKYIGDAIMAVFGAPLQTPMDATNAVRVANEMIRALRRHNTRRLGQGLPSLEIGIGLATGEVLAGSIGSAKRLEYTVIGDSVNLASRLESATKHYGAAILMDGATVAALETPTLRRRLDFLRVKGKARPTEVYESLDHHTEETFPYLERVIELFERSMLSYGRRDWAAAIDGFATALEFAPLDGPSKVYLSRCQYYREHPPGEDWDGVWAMAEK